MSYRYKTILCPVDFDENSMVALNHAKYLAAEMDATLHVLHVVPLTPTVGEIVHRSQSGGDAPAYDRLRGIAERELDGVKHEIHLRFASASEIPKSIVAAADELHADLLVMATHGRSGLSHVFLGSVAEAVCATRVAPCSPFDRSQTFSSSLRLPEQPNFQFLPCSASDSSTVNEGQKMSHPKPAL